MKLVSPGQKIRIAASDWNSMQEAADAFRMGKLSGGSGRPTASPPERFRNDGATAIPRYGLGSLTGAVFQGVNKVTQPTNAGSFPLVIASSPCSPASIFEGWTEGIHPVRVAAAEFAGLAVGDIIGRVSGSYDSSANGLPDLRVVAKLASPYVLAEMLHWTPSDVVYAFNGSAEQIEPGYIAHCALNAYVGSATLGTMHPLVVKPVSHCLEHLVVAASRIPVGGIGPFYYRGWHWVFVPTGHLWGPPGDTETQGHYAYSSAPNSWAPFKDPCGTLLPYIDGAPYVTSPPHFVGEGVFAQVGVTGGVKWLMRIMESRPGGRAWVRGMTGSYPFGLVHTILVDPASIEIVSLNTALGRKVTLRLRA